MARPARYLFDEVFAVPQGTNGASGHGRAELDAAVAAARREAYEAGLAEGRRSVADEEVSRLADAAQRLVETAAALSETAEAERRRIPQDAAELAIAAARKLAPALISRQPMAELEAILRDCLGELRDTPHLAVRLADELVEPMRERLDALCRQTGFAGRIVVLGDPDMALGDGRIDWADGGVVRDRAAMERALDAALERYLARGSDEHERECGNG